MREILVADDHPLFRDALKRALTQAVPDAVMLEADGVASLQALVEEHADAELLLLDLQMPGANWIWSGDAIGPMSLRTHATSSLRNSSLGSVPVISVT